MDTVVHFRCGKKIQIVDDQFTSPVYIPHFSEMVQEIIAKKITGLFHLSGNTRISRYQLAFLLAQKLEFIHPVKKEPITIVAHAPKDSIWEACK